MRSSTMEIDKVKVHASKVACHKEFINSNENHELDKHENNSICNTVYR